MKRICLLMMLLALLLTGCAEPEPATVATISPGPISVTVSSVDEFLEAIGYLGSGKSFRAQKTGEMVRFGEDFADTVYVITGSGELSQIVDNPYVITGSGKKAKLIQQTQEKPKEPEKEEPEEEQEKNGFFHMFKGKR